MPIDPKVREQIEPGVMGDTVPEEQKILENLSHIAAGYAMAKMGGSAMEGLFSKISSRLTEAGNVGNSIDAIHKLAGLTPEESAIVKPLSQQADPFAEELRRKWVTAARENVQPDSLQDISRAYHYINPRLANAASVGLGTALASKGFPLPQDAQSALQSVKDRLHNNESIQ